LVGNGCELLQRFRRARQQHHESHGVSLLWPRFEAASNGGQSQPSIGTTNYKGCNRQPCYLILSKFLPHFAGAVDRLTGPEVVQLEELTNLNFSFLALAIRVRSALAPLKSLFARLHLDDPVSGDQFL